MRRRITVIATALALALGLSLIPGTAQASQRFRMDDASYNGSYSVIGAYTTGNATLYTIRDIRGVVELPRRYRNNFCAYARFGIDGVFKAKSRWDCDTNGDATLTFYIRGPLYASRGQHLEVWFSDPVTRYVITHPSIRL